MTKGNGLPCKVCGTSEWNNQGYCRECKRASDRKWYLENKEYRKESSKRWREENPEKCAEAKRIWQKENKNKVNASNRKSYRKHIDKNKARIKNWQRNNIQKATNWKRNNKGKVLSYQQKRRAKKSGNGGAFTPGEWAALCSRYDNKCLCCGEKRKLTADHIIPLSLGGSSNISNIQPLCGSCNSRKGVSTTDYR